MRLVAAIAEAQGKSPHTQPGPWCKFKRCKAVCPHFTGPKFDLAKMDLSVLSKNKPTKGAPVAGDWSTLFGLYLPVCDRAEEVIKEIRKQAHEWLEAGNQIVNEAGEPAYKLVDKRATESYTDEIGALRHAVGLGVAKDDAVETKVKSPAQLAIVMEPFMEGSTKDARKKEARQQLKAFTKSVSSGTTLAPVDDKRVEAVPVSSLVNALAEKLKQLEP